MDASTAQPTTGGLVSNVMVELVHITDALLKMLEHENNGPELLYRALIMRMRDLNQVLFEERFEGATVDDLSMRVRGVPAKS